MPDETKQPQPEKLQVQGEAPADDAPEGSDASQAPSGSSTNAVRTRRATYRPSTKATFIGLAVVGLIVAINIGVIAFVMRGQDTTPTVNKETVTLSSETLNKLGMSKTAVDNVGTELVVGPNAKFNGTVTVGSDVKIAGTLNLNNTLEAAGAKFAKLQAQEVDLQQINVSGDGTFSSLNLRKDITVVGATKLQGQVTVGQLMTVNNNLNVVGSLAVGGTLTVRNFSASSLTSDTTLTIGGHVVTRGNAPSVSPGGGIGTNGTVSISGNDTAGTVAVNTGTGAPGGLLASVAFTRAYPTTPHVVVTAIGGYVSLYITRTSSGFNIYSAGALPPAGFAFDYFVTQ